jgi:preprotein translocase subunit YajC
MTQMMQAASAAILSQTGDSAAAGALQPQSCLDPANLSSMLPIVAMIAIFYFLIIRPQQKQQKELKRMRESLKKDDRVVTSGGIHGVVAAVKGDIVSVRIADNVRVDVDRSAIATVTRSQEGETS